MFEPLFVLLFPLTLLPMARATTPGQIADALEIVCTDPSACIGNDRLTIGHTWQRLQVPEQERARLGNLQRLVLRVQGLANQVNVTLNARSGPEGTVGVNIQRSGRGSVLSPTATFTLTHPGIRASYTFRLPSVDLGVSRN